MPVQVGVRLRPDGTAGVERREILVAGRDRRQRSKLDLQVVRRMHRVVELEPDDVRVSILGEIEGVLDVRDRRRTALRRSDRDCSAGSMLRAKKPAKRSDRVRTVTGQIAESGGAIRG